MHLRPRRFRRRCWPVVAIDPGTVPADDRLPGCDLLRNGVHVLAARALAGFAGGMILGVSQRFLPFIYGFRGVAARTSASATVSDYQGWVHFISLYDAPWRDSDSKLVRTGQPALGVVLELCILGMFASIVLLVRAFGLLSEGGARPSLRAKAAYVLGSGGDCPAGPAARL